MQSTGFIIITILLGVLISIITSMVASWLLPNLKSKKKWVYVALATLILMSIWVSLNSNNPEEKFDITNAQKLKKIPCSNKISSQDLSLSKSIIEKEIGNGYWKDNEVYTWKVSKTDVDSMFELNEICDTNLDCVCVFKSEKNIKTKAFIYRSFEGNKCRTCSPIIGIAMINPIKGIGENYDFNKNFVSLGNYGELPEVFLTKIGEDKTALLFDWEIDMNRGNRARSIDIFNLESYNRLFSEVIESDNLNSGIVEPYASESEIFFKSNESNTGYYDLFILDKNWDKDGKTKSIRKLEYSPLTGSYEDSKKK